MTPDEEIRDDLSRPVYGVFGIPVDAVTQKEALQQVERAIETRRPFLMSTPNLNFLIQSLTDEQFRASLLQSDLCTPDGMPLVWLMKFAGATISKRVAGSDLFDEMKDAAGARNPIKIFIFGGLEGIADRACTSINAATNNTLECVGSYYPGFGNVADMSDPTILATINASGADFLAVSLGAQKGQAWLMRNHHRLTIPVRVHLGATINFEVGAVQRAPKTLRNSGLEWLWRIKEEPHLWRRYWGDALNLGRLLLTRALPLAVLKLSNGRKRYGEDFGMDIEVSDEAITARLLGPAMSQHVSAAIPPLCQALKAGKPVIIDCAAVTNIDCRFIGLLLLVGKRASTQGGMRLTNVSGRARRILSLNSFEFLL